MRGLYKGRYLIAIYDSNDNLIDSATKVADLHLFNQFVIYYAFHYGNILKRYGYRIELIDCLEKHNDIFKEEDEIFLQEIREESEDYCLEQRAKQLGISKRTAYRWKKLGKLGDIENVI